MEGEIWREIVVVSGQRFVSLSYLSNYPTVVTIVTPQFQTLLVQGLQESRHVMTAKSLMFD